MARIYRHVKSSCKAILLVDDSEEYCEATRLVLEHEGHTVHVAYNGPEALKLLAEKSVDLVLLDYFMPEMTGEEVISEIRKYNPTVQIILQTGYASENPSRDLLRKLNIQGYHDKSEGTEKLLLWVDVGLKAALTVKLLDKSRKGLKYILEITPELHKIQPLDDLLQGILLLFSGLLGFNHSFMAVLSNEAHQKNSNLRLESFLAMLKDDLALRIHAGIGKYEGKRMLEEIFDKGQIDTVTQVLRSGKCQHNEKNTIIPLQIGEHKIGVIYLEENLISQIDLEMVNVFANQAAVAIQNAQLYEMATRDQLTGVNVRRYALQLLTNEVRVAFYSKVPLTVILFDLDNLKKINDSAGHAAGDRVLALIGSILKKVTRSNDLVGRYGGDEFTVILPATDSVGALHVAERIFELMRREKVYIPGEAYPISGSMGIITINSFDRDILEFQSPVPLIYFKAMVQVLLKIADNALYVAKDKGRDCFKQDCLSRWYSYDEVMKLYESHDEVA